MSTPKIADLLPAAARRVVYIGLTLAVALEAIWDVVPDALEGKLGATLVALGFVLAAGNTPAE